MAMVTDYDVWHVSEQPVTVDIVVQNLAKNVDLAKKIVKRTLPLVGDTRTCECATAMRDACITQKSQIPKEYGERYDLLFGKYLQGG
jgi:5'-methylthioadenosine phosphorylase